MKLMTGMVIASVKSPNVYNEIIRLYTENGKRMVEVEQFGIDWEDIRIVFFEKEVLYMLKKGAAHIVNNWESRN